MTLPAMAPPLLDTYPWARALEDIPILYEDEEAEEEDMGEANYHVETDEIFHNGLDDHLKTHYPDLRAFSNMNLYYKKDGPPHPKTGSPPYVSPDGMAVRPYQPLPKRVRSYTIGVDGPAPLLVAEILSQRSAQQRDLKEKLTVYAKLGVREYLLIDVAGLYLREPLLLKRLQTDGTWQDVKDTDGGITSELGFRVIVEGDGEIRLLDAATGWKYVRPKEANQVAKALKMAEAYGVVEAEGRVNAEKKARAEAEARRVAEDKARAEAEARRVAEHRLQELQAELDRLRSQAGAQPPS